MTKESYALLTGLFVLVLGAAMIGIAALLGNYGVERDIYTVVTTGSVSGLNAEAAVIYRGVPAGKVLGIDFDPKDVKNILVRVEINRGLPITQGTYATLRIQGLTGLAQVELDDKGDDPEPLATSQDHPARIPLRPSLIDRITASGEDLLPKLTQLADQLNSLVGEGNRNRVESILTSADVATKGLISLEKQATDTLSALPRLSQDTRQTVEKINQLTGEFQATSQRVRAAADATEAFAQSGRATAETMQSLSTQLLPRVDALAADLKRTTDHIRRLSFALERDPQALLFGPQSPPPGPGEAGYEEQP
jgi:phospholipid/cholesterol/gamma-HCH transport system substrate-binding protein